MISDPDADAERIVIVSLTSHRADKDQACILRIGDHPYVKHDTCVNYRDAKVVSLASLDTLLKSGKTVRHSPCSPGLLQRIRDGVADSRMELGVVAILVEQSVIEEP